MDVGVAVRPSAAGDGLSDCGETTTGRQNIVLKRQASAELGRLCLQPNNNNTDPVAGDK